MRALRVPARPLARAPRKELAVGTRLFAIADSPALPRERT